MQGRAVSPAGIPRAATPTSPAKLPISPVISPVPSTSSLGTVLKGKATFKRKGQLAQERRVAAEAMEELGRLEPRLRRAAAEKLQPLMVETIVPHAATLSKRLLDKDETVRFIIAGLVAQFPKEASKPLVDMLVSRMSFPDFKVICDAIMCLERMGEAGANALAGQLQHHNPEVRVEVAAAMGRLGEVAKPHLGSLAVLLDDGSLEVRLAACWALGALREVAAPQAAALAACIGGKEAALRLAAAEALGFVGAAATPFANDLAKEMEEAALGGSAGDRRRVAEALALMGEAGAAALVPYLGHHDPRVRVAVVEVFGDMGVAVVAHLVGLAGCAWDPDPLVRGRAAEALGKQGRVARPHAAAVASLLWDSDAGVRRLAAEALNDIGSASGMSEEQMASLLRDGEEGSRMGFAGVTGGLADPLLASQTTYPTALLNMTGVPQTPHPLFTPGA